MKVSVIMPVYNCESTVGDAIHSILNQTFQDFEIIVCDDCSTDGTYNIVSAIAKEYFPKIMLIKNEKNCGAGITRNHCIDLAQGEYIALMDGDDISHQTRLEQEVNFLDKNPQYDIVGSRVNFFDDKGIYGKSKQCGNVSKKMFVKGSPFVNPSTMLRLNSVRAINGYTNLYVAEDFELWLRMYKNGCIGYNLPEVLCDYREDKNSYKHKKMKYRWIDFRIICNAIKEFELSPIYYIISIRTLLIGLLPKHLYTFLHRLKLKNKND